MWRPSGSVRVRLAVQSAYSPWLTRGQHATRPAHISARLWGGTTYLCCFCCILYRQSTTAVYSRCLSRDVEMLSSGSLLILLSVCDVRTCPFAGVIGVRWRVRPVTVAYVHIHKAERWPSPTPSLPSTSRSVAASTRSSRPSLHRNHKLSIEEAGFPPDESSGRMILVQTEGQCAK